MTRPVDKRMSDRTGPVGSKGQTNSGRGGAGNTVIPGLTPAGGAVDDRNWAAETPPTDWQGRCNLARSILNHRPASEHAAELAVMALTGHEAQAIYEYDAAVR